MNCAIELNQQRTRLERFVRESCAGDLTLIKSSFASRRWGIRHEVEVLEKQLHEMQSGFCHPEALSWLQRTATDQEINRKKTGLTLVR